MAKKAKRRPVQRVTLSQAQREDAQAMINKILAAERAKLCDLITDEIVCAFVVAAYDHFDVTGEELKAFADKAMFQFDCVEAGTISIEDFKDLLWSEANFDLKDSKHAIRDKVPNFSRIKHLETLCANVNKLIKQEAV